MIIKLKTAVLVTLVFVLSQSSYVLATIIPSFNNFNTAGSYEDWTKTGVATKETTIVHGGTGEAVNVRAKGGYPSYVYKDFASDPGSYTQMQLSFWMYEYSANANDQSLNIALQDTTTVGYVGPNLRIKVKNGVRSLVHYYNIDNPANPGTALLVEDVIASIVMDQWSQLTISASTISDTFTVQYNGVMYNNNGNGYSFYQPINEISRVQFSNTNGSAVVSRTTIDDVSIIVPEPCTIAILALGALAFRKKKA
ncbi:MAG: hypothetical protein A2Y12_16925 [Planctomycetes bacterium GWF2_42_9]|nr:MAG: hypothetical protein A2Y12_16925 [Planctomycetes bacterium GWF2_42_9]